jgi:hypothetical protein
VPAVRLQRCSAGDDEKDADHAGEHYAHHDVDPLVAQVGDL